jgi:hypothetical protein
MIATAAKKSLREGLGGMALSRKLGERQGVLQNAG